MNLSDLIAILRRDYAGHEHVQEAVDALALSVREQPDAAVREEVKRLGSLLDAVAIALDLPKESWRIAGCCDLLAHQTKAAISALVEGQEDTFRIEALPRFASAIIWKPEAKLPTLGTLKDGFDSGELRAWLDEASEQNAPCPPGCCVMAEEKDVRSILAAIDEENKPFPADQPVGEVVDVTHAYGTIVRWQRDMKRGELLYASPPALENWSREVRVTIRGIDGQAKRLTHRSHFNGSTEEVVDGYQLNTGLWHRLLGLLASCPATEAPLSPQVEPVSKSEHGTLDAKVEYRFSTQRRRK